MTERPAIRVREDFIAKAAARGLATHSAIARAIGVNQSNVGRVLRNQAKPSNEFIAGVRTALGEFDEFFEIQ